MKGLNPGLSQTMQNEQSEFSKFSMFNNFAYQGMVDQNGNAILPPGKTKQPEDGRLEKLNVTYQRQDTNRESQMKK